MLTNNTLCTVVVFTFNLVNMVCVFLVLSVPKKKKSQKIIHQRCGTLTTTRDPAHARLSVMFCGADAEREVMLKMFHQRLAVFPHGGLLGFW